MHIFPQFTRSAPWGEFAWVEAIIFRGNFMMGRQFSWGQFSSWAIILGENCLGTISRGAIIQGTLICEAISLGYNCPKTVKTEYKKMNAQKTDLIFLCHIKMKFYLHVIIFLLLCDNKNISPWHNILNTSKQKFGVARKIILCWNKKFDVTQKVICCRQKRVNVARKSVSCRQKQDDAASKKYFLRWKVIIFFQNGTPHNL